VLPTDQALAEYHRERDRHTLRDYRLNAHLARNMAAPDELLRLRAQVRGDAEASRRYVLRMQGVDETNASYLEGSPLTLER
jgi:hypothetical protein